MNYFIQLKCYINSQSGECYVNVAHIVRIESFKGEDEVQTRIRLFDGAQLYVRESVAKVVTAMKMSGGVKTITVP